ncbi:MAG: cyclic nucleotide-binding domain-containing protein [Deltaproteobacteria bacterium]|nr:cyclic nucleotide-binding domain-containing protein [Deltaproteobacteria bacterium]
MAVDERSVSAVKDKAEGYFSKGKLKEAVETYETIRSYSGKDPKIALRLGDIYRKLGKNSEAVDAYKLAINVFITQGFVTKAIGVCKIIMDIDPSQTGVQKKIAELYTTKGIVGEGEKKAETSKPPDVASGDRPAASQPSSAESPAKAAEEQPVKFPRTPLFSDLTRDELLAVIGKVKHQIISPGVFVFQEGDRGDSIYIVVSGELDIIARDKKGNNVVLATLKEGDFFGEFGFFSNARREASVRATTPASILEIVKSDIDDIIARHKRVAQVLFNFYKERVVDRLMAISPIFEPLTAADRKAILARLSSEKFEQDANVVNQGEIGDTMYLIKEGKVKVWVDDPQKGKIVMAVLEEGDFFGEIALATSKPRVANCTALTNVELVLFSRPMIKDILAKYPDIRKALEDVIKARVADVIKAKGLQSAALI